MGKHMSIGMAYVGIKSLLICVYLKQGSAEPWYWYFFHNN